MEEAPLKSLGLRGMSHIPSYMVVIDSKISAVEQNFFCMHENLHHVFHKHGKTKSFKGYEKVRPGQNKIIEWEANEGAAQFLVPYQLIIPDFFSLSKKNARKSAWDYDLNNLCKELSLKYKVTPGVINNRLKNLRYEIYYYYYKRSFKGIKLLSNYEIGRNKWNVDVTKTYCINCLSPVLKNACFCHICGKQLKKSRNLELLISTNKGVSYMRYDDGCKVDGNLKAIECPKCGNEEIIDEGNFCKICGTPVVNRCTDMDIQDSYDSWHVESGCGKALDSNARYCPYCGHESTYFQQKLLVPWEEAKKEIEAKSLESFDEAAVTSADADNQDNVNGDDGDFVEIDDDDEPPF